MPSEKPIKITLYHAEWCGHCRNFMPTWETMKQDGEARQNIEFKEVEDIAMDALSESERSINGEKISGFPTIRVDLKGKSYNYMGERQSDDIYGFIVKRLHNMVDGIDTTSSEGGVSQMNPTESEVIEMHSMSSEKVEQMRMTGGNPDLTLSDIPIIKEMGDVNTASIMAASQMGGESQPYQEENQDQSFATRLGSDTLKIQELNTLSEMVRFD